MLIKFYACIQQVMSVFVQHFSTEWSSLYKYIWNKTVWNSNSNEGLGYSLYLIITNTGVCNWQNEVLVKYSHHKIHLSNTYYHKTIVTKAFMDYMRTTNLRNSCIPFVWPVWLILSRTESSTKCSSEEHFVLDCGRDNIVSEPPLLKYH